MRRYVILAGLVACGDAPPAAERVLVYSRTLGYRHADAITAGQATLVTRLGADGIAVDATEDPLRFRDADLATFGAVIFLYTSGNDVLDAEGKLALEAFVRGGGGWVGVHSAADTEYAWPFYGELVVAHFLSHPAIQPATTHLADGTPWPATDEWYDFRANPRDTSGVRVLITVDEATYTGGTMGADHPLAWAHERAGGRAFYTAMGHTAERWSEAAFLDHVAGGVRWTLHRE
jgi:type 1 glutamine amidotransferase